MIFSRVFIVACIAPFATAFSPSGRAFVSKSSLRMGFDLSGNDWKPDNEKQGKPDQMGSTDTGDFFPDDYEAGVGFEEGMMGSQSGGGGKSGPELPGMENLGEDAIMVGGIEEATDIPAGMEFIPSYPAGKADMSCGANGSGTEIILDVKPVCMGFEDYYAGFSADSHPSFAVSPVAGRMDRRGGEMTQLEISCKPKGASGTLTGDLVINLPDDDSSLCYKITCNSM